MNETRKQRMESQKNKIGKKLGAQRNKQRGRLGNDKYTQPETQVKNYGPAEPKQPIFDTKEINEKIEKWFKKGVEVTKDYSAKTIKETEKMVKKAQENAQIKKQNKVKIVKPKPALKNTSQMVEPLKQQNFGCKVGYPLHQQKMQYGKETVEFYFGGYINEKTIAIVVENVLGTRAYSSTFFFQVEKDTVFDLPGLYNDGTGSFKNVWLRVVEMNPAQNTIRFEKIEN